MQAHGGKNRNIKRSGFEHKFVKITSSFDKNIETNVLKDNKNVYKCI